MLSRILVKDNQGKYVQYLAPKTAYKKNCSYVRIRPLPKENGQGAFSTISIKQGLGIGICRGRFDTDYAARLTLDKPSVYFGFCIKGQTKSWNSCRPDPVTMTPDRSYVYYFDDPVYKRQTKGQQDVLVLVIRATPEMLLQLLDPSPQQEKNYDDDLTERLEKALHNRHLYADHPMTTGMKTTLYQIFNNPHQGRVGRIFLESKALELIAQKLGQVEQLTDRPQPTFLLSPEDKERIYQARDFLIKELQYPPSLNELAKQVGMSHTRLNRGFKKVFGCTAFEYLRRERLAYARMLIEENPVDLTRIAYEAGFCSSSHFATAFQKEYGIRPSEYRKGQ